VKTPYDRWRDKARAFLSAGIRPEHADWQDGLLAERPPERESAMPRVPVALVDLLQRAACHRDPARNALMYRLLWRVVHGGRRLLRAPIVRIPIRLPPARSRTTEIFSVDPVGCA